MKKLETLAAKYGYYNLGSLPEHVKNDKYFKDRPEWATEAFYDRPIPEGLKALKTVQVGAFARVREQFNNDGSHDLYYVDGFETLVLSEKTDMLLALRYYKGKYSLHPINRILITAQEGATYNQIRPYTDGLGEPNRIGVFTDRKINDWIDYCIAYVDACKKAAEALREKKQANLATVEDFIKSTSVKNVQRNGKYTTVETNFFTVDFEMEDGGEYLRTKIRFEGDLETIINNRL